MSRVTRTPDLQPSGHRVAIKQSILGPANERHRQRFAQEVAADRLAAPFCTAQRIDIQLEGPTPYLVSEYIEGLSLQPKIAQDGPLTKSALHRPAVLPGRSFGRVPKSCPPHLR
jgi:hypothetical protein